MHLDPIGKVFPLFSPSNLTAVSLLMLLVISWMQKTFQVSASGRSPKSLQSWLWAGGKHLRVREVSVHEEQILCVK